MISLSSIIKVVYYKIHDDSRHFSIPYLKQYNYLRKFREPKSPIERSFFQYKCESYTEDLLTIFLKEFISLLIIFPFTVCLLFRKKNTIQKNIGNNAVIFNDMNTMIYKKLFDSFDKLDSIKFASHYYLRLQDMDIIFMMIRLCPFFPFWIIKNVYKIAIYRFVIDTFAPKSIICASEYSFTSSVLTYYCEQNNIQHINIMHGEKFFFIRDTFFYFHQCYVWDKHYIELFRKLRSCCNHYIVYVPENLKLEIKDDVSEKKYKFTYYLYI